MGVRYNSPGRHRASEHLKNDIDGGMAWHGVIVCGSIVKKKDPMSGKYKYWVVIEIMVNKDDETKEWKPSFFGYVCDDFKQALEYSERKYDTVECCHISAQQITPDFEGVEIETIEKKPKEAAK